MHTQIEQATLKVTLSTDAAEILTRALSQYGDRCKKQLKTTEVEQIGPMVEKLNNIFGFTLPSKFSVKPAPASPLDNWTAPEAE